MKSILSLPLAWGFALLLALSPSLASAQIAKELREDGVLYFDGNLPKDTIPATVKTTTMVYNHRDMQTVIAAAYNGQKIDLIGMSADGYLVKMIYRNNTLTGWIKPADLPPGVDLTLFAEAKKNQAHHDAVAVAIANKSVIQGMTIDEVKQSVGTAQQVSSRSDATGSVITWTYATYREEPQNRYYFDAYNRPVMETDYVKIPIGHLTVDFINGIVTSVAETKVDPYNPGVVTN